jgi:hypothetical protein
VERLRWSRWSAGSLFPIRDTFICFHSFICSHPHVGKNYSRSWLVASGDGRGVSETANFGPQAREFWEFFVPLASGRNPSARLAYASGSVTGWQWPGIYSFV